MLIPIAMEVTTGKPKSQSSMKFFKFIPKRPAIAAPEPTPRVVMETYVSDFECMVPWDLGAWDCCDLRRGWCWRFLLCCAYLKRVGLLLGLFRRLVWHMLREVILLHRVDRHLFVSPEISRWDTSLLDPRLLSALRFKDLPLSRISASASRMRVAFFSNADSFLEYTSIFRSRSRSISSSNCVKSSLTYFLRTAISTSNAVVTLIKILSNALHQFSPCDNGTVIHREGHPLLSILVVIFPRDPTWRCSGHDYRHHSWRQIRGPYLLSRELGYGVSWLIWNSFGREWKERRLVDQLRVFVNLAAVDRATSSADISQGDIYIPWYIIRLSWMPAFRHEHSHFRLIRCLAYISTHALLKDEWQIHFRYSLFIPPLRVLNTVSVHGLRSSTEVLSKESRTGIPWSPSATPGSRFRFSLGGGGGGGGGGGALGSGGFICNIGRVNKVRLKGKGVVGRWIDGDWEVNLNKFEQRMQRRPA